MPRSIKLTEAERTLIHMALRYLRDHGCARAGPTAREIAALLDKLELREV